MIVELKAPNTPLHGEHLRQLQNYIARTQGTLEQWGQKNYAVEGFLIGSHAPVESKTEEVLWLRDQIKKSQHKSEWTVFDIVEVLDLTTRAHQELVEIYEAAAAEGEFEEDEEPKPKPEKKSK